MIDGIEVPDRFDALNKLELRNRNVKKPPVEVNIEKENVYEEKQYDRYYQPLRYQTYFSNIR